MMGLSTRLLSATKEYHEIDMAASSSSSSSAAKEYHELDMAASSSSSSSAAKKYDVFISFRGEDTRATFTSHVPFVFGTCSIRAFIDKNLKKGDEISPALIQAIQDSCGSLVVLSENYASSKWCLNELLEILKCRKQGHFVKPVFYNIDPSHVRKQTGSYAKAFEKHEQDSNNSKEKLDEWKHACFEVGNLAGWDSRNYRDDSELIQEIAKDIQEKLDAEGHSRDVEEGNDVNEGSERWYEKCLLYSFDIIFVSGFFFIIAKSIKFRIWEF